MRRVFKPFRTDPVLLQVHPGYEKIARPLTELTEKDGFKWGQSAHAAFGLLKEVIVTASVLRLPDFHNHLK